MLTTYFRIITAGRHRAGRDRPAGGVRRPRRPRPDGRGAAAAVHGQPLAGSAATPALPAGPARPERLHQGRSTFEGRRHPADLQERQGHHQPGVVPHAPGPVHSRSVSRYNFTTACIYPRVLAVR